MVTFIIQIIIGLILIVIGIFNMNGNISTIHSYNRKNVKKEDIIPFGKKIGLGGIIIGFTIIIAGVLTLLNYNYIGNIVIGIGFTIGLILIFYALFKYNKGIF